MTSAAGEAHAAAPSRGARLSGSLRLYPALTHALAPLAPWHLNRRARRGKEEAARLAERQGRAGRARPEGPVIWVHAASVGESLSALPLIEALLARDPALHVLLTTGTVTSAHLAAERLPPRALHQYVPLDHAPYVRRFLAHWRPDLALWIESEFWPSLLGGLGAAGIPTALVNARISERSFKGWSRFPASIEGLVGGFRLCLAPEEGTAARLARLGARQVVVTGNLKHCAAPLPTDGKAFESLRAAIGSRPVWLAASIHEEDEAILEAHDVARDSVPDLLTIAAPRQPAAALQFIEKAGNRGLRATRRSEGALPTEDTQIYLADTIGEMGTLYRIAEIAFLGRSLAPLGGSNPLEAARLGCAILHGPRIENFRDVFDALDRESAVRCVSDGVALGAAVRDLLLDAGARNALAHAAERHASAQGARVLRRILDSLAPVLPRPALGVPLTPSH